MEQYISAPISNGGNTNELGDMLSWTGVVSDTASWYSGLPLPSPYVFVYSSDSCSSLEDGEIQYGMKWGSAKELVPPIDNQNAPKTKAEVLTWFQPPSSETGETDEVIVISVIAVVLSVIVLSIFVCLLALRFTKPDMFAQALHPKLIISNGEETKNKNENDIQFSRSY